MHGSQPPHSIVPPQPSSWLPQVKPAEAQVFGVQGEQSPAMPPPGHVPSALQGPQSRTPWPQAPFALPQPRPSDAQSRGPHMPQQSLFSQASGGLVAAPQQVTGSPG